MEIENELIEGFEYIIPDFVFKVMKSMDNFPSHIKTDFYEEFGELHTELYFILCLEKMDGGFR